MFEILAGANVATRLGAANEAVLGQPAMHDRPINIILGLMIGRQHRLLCDPGVP
jgi:hypothetical protein